MRINGEMNARNGNYPAKNILLPPSLIPGAQQNFPICGGERICNRNSVQTLARLLPASATHTREVFRERY